MKTRRSLSKKVLQIHKMQTLELLKRIGLLQFQQVYWLRLILIARLFKPLLKYLACPFLTIPLKTVYYSHRRQRHLYLPYLPSILDDIAAVKRELSHYAFILTDIHRWHHIIIWKDGTILQEEEIQEHRHEYLLESLDKYKPLEGTRRHWGRFNPWNSRHLAILAEVYKTAIEELTRDEEVLMGCQGVWTDEVEEATWRWTRLDVKYRYLGRLLLDSWGTTTCQMVGNVPVELPFNLREFSEVMAKIWEDEVDKGNEQNEEPKEPFELIIELLGPTSNLRPRGKFKGPRALRRLGADRLAYSENGRIQDKYPRGKVWIKLKDNYRDIDDLSFIC